MRPCYGLISIILPLLLALGSCSDSSDDTGLTTSVTLANLNVLHGFNCDSAETDTNQCRVNERIALLRQHLVAAGCPDIVTLQEVINTDFAPTSLRQPLHSILELITAELPALTASCGFDYRLVYQPLRTVALAEVDEEVILSRYTVLHTDTLVLYGPLYNPETGTLVFARHVLHARIDHPTGEVDVYTTHLASGSDLGGSLCDPQYCPPECDRNDTVRACQAEQLALFVEQTRGSGNQAIISGDFNAEPGSNPYLSMTNRGWLDSHLAAGSPECDAATGSGCSSGRSSSLDDIENPALGVTRRIDYIFIAQPQSGDGCRISDAGLFADQPNPFATACGNTPNQPCWVSDHSGNEVKLDCRL